MAPPGGEPPPGYIIFFCALSLLHACLPGTLEFLKAV